MEKNNESNPVIRQTRRGVLRWIRRLNPFYSSSSLLSDESETLTPLVPSSLSSSTASIQFPVSSSSSSSSSSFTVSTSGKPPNNSSSTFRALLK
eukprot:CAMPEP_0114393568 /NCGR_PEP_ID=MMETSP0102-20121206/11598_1 /TAXON_ID=38822 ORGANISM="Pteridomonas danica, Strain PT" /NCGR_SAMPLE_ID=MMETSP0102 /ASSEMBLY_ACC=CAM_ASM_000212 /LENGTH=93 /DNA_ID=CAMNT_0001553217 /DNA_START=212 /DNA_END=490 /DNA_ORIENTATION=+